MKRRVFYIPGFDPHPARRYRELYRVESKKQADISNYKIDLKAAVIPNGYGWNVTLEQNGKESWGLIEVLTWSDIVKETMASGLLATYIQLIKTVWIYISTGALFDLIKLRKGPIIAALYPVGFLTGQFLIAVLCASIVWSILADISFALAPFALGIIWLILKGFQAIDHRIFAYYLMQDYAHSAQFKGAYPDDLKNRLDDFSAKITKALREDWDEVLIIGHSSGAHLAISVLAELERGNKLNPSQNISFLSLGQVVPMVSFLPKATQLRQDLHDLSQNKNVTWIDVTAPGDGCSFALCDPVDVTGVTPDQKTGPLVISASFTQTLKAETWKALRWRFFRLHFQYLCAFDRPNAYDYFQITAGSLSLKERFCSRQASKSRITTPVSRYRSIS